MTKISTLEIFRDISNPFNTVVRMTVLLISVLFNTFKNLEKQQQITFLFCRPTSDAQLHISVNSLTRQCSELKT